MSRRKMIDEAIDALVNASRITRAEFASRANAYPDIMSAIGKATTTLKALNAVGRVSSDDMASLASRINRMEAPAKVTKAAYDQLLAEAKSLAGSVMSQADGPEEADPNQLGLDIEGTSARALRDAQEHGQAKPLERTVVIGPGSTGLKKDGNGDVT